jgi:hypothetical protein
MSILAYLIPPHNPLKMPDAEKTPNQCGIKWQGPVLSGRRSLNQSMNIAANSAKGCTTSVSEPRP